MAIWAVVFAAIEAKFDRALLLDHFMCTTNSYVLALTPSLYSSTGEFTLSFWVASEKPPDDNLRSLISFIDSGELVHKYEISKLGTNNIRLSFKSAQILTGIVPIASVLETSYPKRAAFSPTVWTFHTISFEKFPTPGNTLSKLSVNGVLKTPADLNSFNINSFKIVLGSDTTTIGTCSLPFVIRHFYIYDAVYSLLDDVRMLMKNVPGTLAGLFQPRGYQTGHQELVNMAPGRLNGNIVIYARPKLMLIKTYNYYTFILDRYETRMRLPQSIVPNSPVDQSYIYTLLFQSYCTYEYYYQYSVKGSISENFKMTFSMYERARATQPSWVLIGSEWHFFNFYNHQLVTSVNNDWKVQLSGSFATATLASSTDKVENPQQKTFFLLSVLDNCLVNGIEINFYSHPFSNYTETASINLDPTDIHFFGKKTTETHSGIEFHIGEVSIVHGSQYVRTVDSVNNTIIATPNYPSTKYTSVVMATSATISIKRDNDGRNDVMKTDTFNPQDGCPSTSVSNCILYFASNCQVCQLNFFSLGNTCSTYFDGVYDYVTRKIWIGQMSTFNYSTDTTISNDLAAVFANLTSPSIVLAKFTFQSIIPGHTRPYKTYFILNSMDFSPYSPETVPKSDSDFSNKNLQIKNELSAFEANLLYNTFKITKMEILRVSYNLYRDHIPWQYPGSKCSYFGRKNQRESRFKDTCVQDCQTGFELKNDICQRQIVNCALLDGPACLYCNSGYLLVNNKCYRMRGAVSPPPSPPDTPLSGPGGTSSPIEIDYSTDPRYIADSENSQALSTYDCSDAWLVAHYLDSIQAYCSQQCQSIRPGCQLCTSSACVQCLDGYSLQESNCVRVNCPDLNCDICASSMSCKVCAAGYSINYLGVCQIKSGMYESNILKTISKSEQATDNGNTSSNPSCSIKNCIHCPTPARCEKCDQLFDLSADQKLCVRNNALLVKPPTAQLAFTDSSNQAVIADSDSGQANQIDCNICQKGQQLACLDNPKCQDKCKCYLNPLSKIDTFRLDCPNVFFNRTNVDLTSKQNNPYTLAMSPKSAHSLEITFRAISFQARTFRLTNNLLNYTEDCNNDEGRLYIIKEQFSTNYTKTKAQMSIVTKSSTAATSSSVFVFNLLGINLSQFLIGIINLSSFFSLIDLLNIRLGLYFDFICKAVTEDEFKLSEIAPLSSYSSIYAQAFDASNSRSWKYFSKRAFNMVLWATIGWFLMKNLIKLIIYLLPDELQPSKLVRVLEWVSGALKALFITIIDFNFMGLATMSSWFILQPSLLDDARQSAVAVVSNLIVVLGLVTSKHKTVTGLMQMHYLSQQEERLQVLSLFSVEVYQTSLHEFIEELLQVAFGSILFNFQRYPQRMLHALSLFSFVQIYLCFWFLGKYNFAITAIKTLFNLSFLVFIVTAQSVFTGFDIHEGFLNKVVLVLSVIKLAETAVTVIVTIIEHRIIKKRRLSLKLCDKP